jgi:DNA-binding CsgD family transcriptional regulator
LALANRDMSTARRVARERILEPDSADYSTKVVRVFARFVQLLIRWILNEEVVALPIPNWLHKSHRGEPESITNILRLPRISTTLEQIERAFDSLRFAGAIGIRDVYVHVITDALAFVNAHEGISVSNALTPAQEEILAALRRGESNKEIAASSGRSVNTVRTHVAAVLAKLGYKTRSEVAANYRP